jgi:hypothetical protein
VIGFIPIHFPRDIFISHLELLSAFDPIRPGLDYRGWEVQKPSKNR